MPMRKTIFPISRVLKIFASILLLISICLMSVNGQSSSSISTLERAIARLAETSGGTVGVSAIHIETGRRVSYNAQMRFPMASVYKMPIALQALRRIDRGEIRLSDTVTVTPRDFRPGYSPLINFAHNTPVTLTVERLIELMLGDSDNTASDLALRLAGGAEAVGAFMRELGVGGIDVSISETPLMFVMNGARELPPESEWSLAHFERLQAHASAEQRREGIARFNADPRDTATPEAMANLLSLISRGELLSPASRELLLRVMRETTTGAARLRGLLPVGTIVAHKTGTFGNAGTTNDVGIITLPDSAGRIAIAVFVKQSTRDIPERERAIAEIARTIYDFFLLQPENATRATSPPRRSL